MGVDLGAGGCGSGVAGGSGGVDRIANPALRSYEARQAKVCCCCDESFVQTEESRMVIVRVPCAGAWFLARDLGEGSEVSF